MVQEFSPLKSHAGYLNEALAPVLGQGLGNFYANYRANKTLEDILSDPKLKEAPVSEKLQALTSGLGRHGKIGQGMLQNQFNVLQQEMMEKEQAKQLQQQQSQQGLLAKAIRGEQLTPEEEQSLPIQAQLKLAQIRQPKNPPGGLSGQPVPQEISQLIPQILNANKDANADQLAQSFDSAGIPRAYSNSYIENRRRQDEAKASGSQKALERGYDLNKGYLDKVMEGSKAADEMDMRLDQMLSLKDLPTPLMATTLETLGLPSSLFSADAETAEKLSIDLTKNIQQFYGNRILQTEFQSFLRSIPTLKNTPEGRKRIIENMKIFNELKRKEYNTAREKEIGYEEQNKPLPPSFQRQVFDAMKPEAEKLANEFKNANKQKMKPLEKVKKGTSISTEKALEFLERANGDVDKAMKEAKEAGYEF